LLPTAVLVAGSLLLSLAGYPQSTAFDPSAASGSAEAAARVKVLATSLLLASLGIGCAIAFVAHLATLPKSETRIMIAIWAALTALGVGSLWLGQPEEAHRFVGESFACRAFGALQAAQDKPVQPPPAATTEATKAPPASAVAEPARIFSKPQDCHAPQWQQMRVLNGVQRYLLAFVTPCIVLGMIACLASKGGDTLRSQSERLNTYLYLAAALLVAGLLFLSALLRWPGFSLPKDPRAIYDAHAGAIVLYWGVVYSLFNAAIYLPVAHLLKRRFEERATGAPASTGDSLSPADTLWRPVTMLKTASAIFAPAIAGLLSDVVKI
jgi:cytochrome c biogenesis protein CcdA